eukprot:6181670-Pleurochrysis_carterae.AAC.4
MHAACIHRLICSGQYSERACLSHASMMDSGLLSVISAHRQCQSDCLVPCLRLVKCVLGDAVAGQLVPRRGQTSPIPLCKHSFYDCRLFDTSTLCTATASVSRA